MSTGKNMAKEVGSEGPVAIVDRDALPRLAVLEDRLIEAEAIRAGLSVGRRPKDRRFLTVTDGKSSFMFFGGWCNRTSNPVTAMAKNKHAAKAIMKGGGASVTRGELFHVSEKSEALGYAACIGYPVVVKPNNGIKGSHVYVGMGSDEDVSRAFDSISKHFNYVLIEGFFKADEYRFTLVGDKVIGVVRRIPAYVVGDGSSSVRELIDEKNIERRKNPAHPPIVVDGEVERILSSVGLGLESIPEAGRTVQLRRNSNVSTGGEAIDVTDSVADYYKEQVEMASRGFRGLYVAGFDVLIRDLSEPQGDYAIIEVNHDPMFSLHHYPWVGQPKNVARLIVQGLYPGAIRN